MCVCVCVCVCVLGGHMQGVGKASLVVGRDAIHKAQSLMLSLKRCILDMWRHDCP